MRTLGLTIRIVVEVDDAAAKAFLTCPPGFLMIGGEALGSEELRVSVVNEPSVEPTGMNVTLVELPPSQRESFLA